MNSMTKWIAVALAMLSLVAVVAGCGPTSAPVATAEVAAPTSPPPTGAPTQPPKLKELVIGVTVDMTTFDFTYPLDQGTRSILWNLNDPLFRMDEPVLVDTYTMIDPSTWEFTLKAGIKFHNGMPLTADDIKFTIETILDPDRDPPSIIKSRMAHIDKVDVIDELTFRIHTSRPDVVLPKNLISFTPVPRQYYEENGLDYVAAHPVGVGPFKFVEWVKDSHITLEANQNYWGGAPKIDRVTYRLIPESSARMAALRAGEVDIVIYIPPEEMGRLANEGFKVVTEPIERTVIVAFNQAVCEPCRNKLVRQAMIYAVDREAISNEILSGLGQVVPTLVAPENLGYNKNLQIMPYDPERAKELLAEAGYSAGFELNYYATEGRMTKDKEVAQAIVGYLREVGINVTLQTMPYQEFINLKNASEFKDLWMIGWANGNFDGPSNASWLMKSGSTLWADQCVKDPEMDTLIDAANAASTIEDRAANMKAALQYAYDQAYFMPLYRYLDSFAISPRVINWEAPMDEIVTVGVQTDVTD